MSWKIGHEIKKSNMPSTLKQVLEAYVSFGNKDGTHIRPSESKVGQRATKSRTTVNRVTRELISLGILVHDRNSEGRYLTYSYGNGNWAYVYHVDPTKLSDPELNAMWKEKQEDIAAKRRAAGASNTKTLWSKGTSGNPDGRPVRPDVTEQNATNKHSKMLQTNRANWSDTEQSNLIQSEQSNLQHNHTLIQTIPNTNPSAVITAVSNQINKEISLAPAAPSHASLTPAQEEQVLVSKQETGVHELNSFWVDHTKNYFSWEDKVAAARLVREWGLDEVRDVLINTLNERPKSASIPWSDFNVFARNYDLNRKLWLAWGRAQKAKAKLKSRVSVSDGKGLPAYRQESGKRNILGKGDI